MQETLKYLNKLLHEDDSVVIACSGGPDSMFLLNQLLKLKKEKNLELICAHVNHNLRDESQEEYIYLKNLCQQNNIQFEYYKIEKYAKGNIENQARTIRYKFLEEVVYKYNAKYLMTAHHGDDLIETILMRITRGSNLKGYSGFKICTQKNHYQLIRPLIFVTKEEIINYLDKNNIKYFIDKTNNSDKYTRNRYRQQILPFLKEENSKVHRKYLLYSTELQECSDYIDRVIDNKINKIYEKNYINIDNLNKEDPFIIKAILERILKVIYKDDINLINQIHLSMIIKLIASKNNKSIDLPLNIKFIKEYNIIKIEKNDQITEEYQFIFKKRQELPSNYEIIQIDKSVNHNNYHIYLNSNEITLPLIIRSRQNGDTMAVKNLNGHKKVKDILIDEKIPSSQRKVIPIVTDSQNNILWIPGVKKSKFDKEKNQNYDIILKYQLKEGEMNE